MSLQKVASLVAGIFFAVMLLSASGLFFVVDETRQAVVTQFGEPMGEPITKAGLYFKMPFVQTANYFEKRVLQWDGDQNQITTREKRYIWVDAMARWRIKDALKFMQSVGTMENAYTRLDDIIDAVTRDEISNLNLIETVRNGDELLRRIKESETHEEYVESDPESLEEVKVGREQLTRHILSRAAKDVENFGIELLDVRIKRVNYIPDVRKKVFDRMIAERKSAAEKYRSEGQGKKAEIEGQMVKEMQQIRSEAYRTAQEIRGKADAESIKIFAEAYNKDPEFYSFVKTLDTYRSTVGATTTIMLTTDGEYFEYLKGIGRTSSP